MVADTGIGISADKQRLIFDAFAQADSSTTRKYGGSGLGLAISSRLVEMMGGHIWVESEVAKGSMFHFTVRFGRPKRETAEAVLPQTRHPQDLAVPLTRDLSTAGSSDSSRLPVVEPRPQSLTPPPGRKLRILVGEDNRVNCQLVVRLLEQHGHTVVVAGNGREVLEALEGNAAGTFDVVLMDVQMPQMDGLEATAAIRAREKVSGAHLPIVAMTAHALKGDRERFLAAGMDAYVPKPLHADELLATVESLTSSSITSRRADPQGPPASEVLNAAGALKPVDGDAQLLAEIVELFLEDCPRQLSAIRDALTRDDIKAVADAAHRLKGSVGILAALAALQAAGRLEPLDFQGELTHGPDAYQVLEAETHRLG
jgi:CheY-like chemotaxis protein/HPt (histidine-containing phosphotransfer) domain-containing protein